MNSPLDIAVVAVGGVFPGAPDTTVFWQNIAAGRSAIAEVAPGRWIAPVRAMVAPGPVPDKALSPHCGLVRDFTFDPHGFRVSAEALAELDPLYHLVLQAGREAVSGGCLDAVRPERTGTILAAIALPTDGASALARRLFMEAVSAECFHSSVSHLADHRLRRAARVTSLPAALLAAALGLGGGSFTLDAACASSLYAVRLACDALSAGRLDAVLAGGVSRPDCLYTQVGFSQLRALSPSGRCAPFDADADGLVVGEGAGVVVLKRLADALSRGDPILAVIRAAGLSNDTRGNLLAPDSAGQIRAMKHAYDQAGWAPADVDLIECHGAGTPVGDRVEIDSLFGLAPRDSAGHRPCAIGSVKSNIGHLLTAAGAAGLIKTLLALKHRTLPPSLNFQRPADPRLDPQRPFRVQTAAGPWENDGHRARRAAVSAFGFGGINAHLLLEEWTGDPPSKSRSATPRPRTSSPAPVAIVGMAARIGALPDLPAFAEAVGGHRPAVTPIPPRRWRGLGHMAGLLGQGPIQAAWMEDIPFPADRFRIPPAEIPDLLAQQGLMLLAAGEALQDAGLPLRALRERMGAIIGIEFDPEATDFHVRWWLRHGEADKTLPPAMQAAARAHPDLMNTWLKQLGEEFSLPLNASRTVGALGGIVASRVAREFGCGGPSFGVSAGAVGGLQAVEIAARFLQQGETDIMIAGAVELTCDARHLAIHAGVDGAGDQPPGEGAVALVLKRLEDARRDGDRIYAVIEGLGAAGGAFGENEEHLRRSIRDRSLAAAQAEAGPGEKPADVPENAAIRHHIGGTGAVEGLAEMVQVALDLHRGSMPQRRGTGAWSADGHCLHLVLRAADSPVPAARPAPDPPLTAGPTTSIPVGRPLAIPPLDPELASPAGAPPRPDTARVSIPRAGSPTGPAQAHIARIDRLAANTVATAEAHQAFLDLSASLTRQYGQAVALQARLLSTPGASTKLTAAPVPSPPVPAVPAAESPAPGEKPAFDRARCLEFARGLAANVLGPAFAEVDGFAARVRLPDEPLMLVDRIVSIQGEMLSLGEGQIVTEHDVFPDAWYLDGGHAPVCIAVEAGQADLFLCSYLGIDHQVRGARNYRLLDAKVRFHRRLPEPGETIRYVIHIDRFVRQQDTWLFFFRFEGTIDGAPLISMRDGCAGFFTPEEVRRSGGIVLTEAERRPQPGKLPENWQPPVPMEPTALSDTQVEALRRGDLHAAFGGSFQGVTLSENLRLPGGRMHLIDRVRRLDPRGGRFGIGTIEAEADIAGDEWFLTCHFVDDKVMPGTLMYQCCEQTLRVFLQRLGWIAEDAGPAYQPVYNIEAVLKCRGPVTPETRRVVYQVDLREIGYDPSPYAVADALMFADGEPIVMFSGLSLRVDGLTREAIEAFWERRRQPAPPQYTGAQILAFSVGHPSDCFGEPYRPFDEKRFIARLPGPPYLFLDRVVDAGPAPWRLEAGAWATAEYDIPSDAWYFRADRGGGVLPFCILLEIALQACGFLAAYAGSALQSDQPLKFRNLGGRGTLHRVPDRHSGRLTATARLTRVSKAGAMIIEEFQMAVSDRQGPVYTGESTFGFFSEQALSNQVGLREADSLIPFPDETDLAGAKSEQMPAMAPLSPDDPGTSHGSGLPARALRMIDRIEAHLPDGGPDGSGWIQGTKQVDPNEWFFAAHFFQDPVCPGSLGIEALLQLLRVDALSRWQGTDWRIEPLCGATHRWTYRGQVTPGDKTMQVVAAIRERGTKGNPFLRADGMLSVDGRRIYHLENFGLRLTAGPTKQP
jgi:3-oxoacyl-(acyl-carrier-protein) synthase/3-hydroxymyristoyl/3-hydroxydecanoyl-(acyl carrier protein) dehydratase